MRRDVFIVLLLYSAVLCLTFVKSAESGTEAGPGDSDENVQTTNPESQEMKGKIMAFDLYKKLFMQHRSLQLDAVKTIQNFDKYERQYAIVKKMLIQMFKVIEGAKLNLIEWGYVPGDSFTHNDTLKEVVSSVLENTALFGDMVLRLPDIVHVIYDKNRDWQILMGWAVMFSTESKVFDGSAAELLNLMSQEIGLIPKSDDFINPFKQDELKKAFREAPMDEQKKKKKEKYKKTKEKKKGPRLSGMGHTEL